MLSRLRSLPVVAGQRLRLSGPVLLASLLLWLASTSSASGLAARKPTLERTPEWGRLVILWHTMLDHSAEVIYSAARLRELAGQMDQMDADAAGLVKLGLLAVPVAANLSRLFHDRYEYIATRHYTTESQVKLTGLEAAAATAHWIVELQFAVLRRGLRADGAPVDAAAIESTISYELSFLREYDRFEAEGESRRQALLEQQAAGKEVDLKAFEDECERRRLRLLEAYHNRSIRPSRSVKALLPYLVALTRCRPASPLESSSLPGF